MKTNKPVSPITPIFIGVLLMACHSFLLANTVHGSRYMGIHENPVLDKIEPFDLVYASGAGKVPVTSALIISDRDNNNLSSATIRITSGYNASEDILGFTDQNRIHGDWNPVTGVLSLTGRSPVADYQKAIRSVRYENKNTSKPTADTRVVSFTVNDGQGNSNTVSRNILMDAPVAAPVLSNIETAPLVYCINSGAVIITANIRVADTDNTNLSGARIQFTAGYNSNEDFLRFTDQKGIKGSWDPATGILSLSGVSQVANYQAALRSIKYENTNPSDPNMGNHVVSFTVSDGTVESNTLSRNINIHTRVSVILKGGASVCGDDNTSVPLTADFTGTSPWKFTLIRDNANEVNFKEIKTDPYTFQVKQEGTYRIKSVSDAYCPGDTAGSGYARITYKASPTATLSGIDSICPGETASLLVTLTGTPPWNISYRRNNSTPVAVNGITSANYILQVNQTGTYSLSRVEDGVCTGKVSGQGIVRSHSVPTATLSGNATICEYASANLTVALTGAPPWKFSYHRNSENPVEIDNVLTSPRTVTVQKAGTYSLVKVFDKNCQGTVSGTAVINVTPGPQVELLGLAPAYNKQSTEWVPITGNPSGGTFSGPGVIPYNQAWYFVPSLPPVGTHNIVYAYQASPGSCYGYDTVVVRVLESSAVIEFEDDRTKYCLNDPPFTVTGANLANVIGSFTISGGVGLIDHHDNTATVYPQNLAANEYSITYTYFDGVTHFTTSDFIIGESPLADFTWDTECYHQPGQVTTLNSTSTSNFGNITGYNWKIYKTNGYDSYTTPYVMYTFPLQGNYRVELQIQTSYGCLDNIEKEFSLRPTIDLSEENYTEDFELQPMSWRSGKAKSPPANSWMLGDPEDGFIGAASGQYCWYTNIPGPTAPAEQSWITSPCFNFTGTERPMLKLNIWRLFNSNRDGANIQASADSGKTWMDIGELGDGINWFNCYNIRGNPGNSAIGWSNIDGLQDDAYWVEARHSLDMLRGMTGVQFRIAYGSDGTAQGNHGIAFDDFWIGERHRMALMEHFTNASNEDCEAANILLNNLANNNALNIIDLQYHTSFPGPDPFNQYNPSVPGARVFYYGLSRVPYTILNGGSTAQHRFDYDGSPLVQNTALVESLLDSKFLINLNSSVQGNTLHVEAEVYSRENIPATELTIHLAVIEQLVTGVTGGNGETSFESVVKAMLPDAAGTTIYQEWAQGEYRYIDSEWDLQHVSDQDQLRIAAFIQNESTGEVYQVAVDTIGTFIPLKVDDPGSSWRSFMVYPNPAGKTAYIGFRQEIPEDITLEIYNSAGGMVQMKVIPEGTKEMEIPLEHYTEGIYMLRLMSRGQPWGTVRLTVSKQH